MSTTNPNPNPAWLAAPLGLAVLAIEDDNEQQAVHETVLQQVLVPSENRVPVSDTRIPINYHIILRGCPFYGFKYMKKTQIVEEYTNIFPLEGKWRIHTTVNNTDSHMSIHISIPKDTLKTCFKDD
ncbi:hypothetical protein BLNAU_25014 [Blattamonas nauphoetae]|uniref:Uncharacterized protein n=1 Tax=Blattamonas nauphoetae TaxID=2049346 RepID=A0ABQ9WKT8_9EUKA|nr:hypothetical protein BLNAU_25014 [Blattamonas nauphoetae]